MSAYSNGSPPPASAAYVTGQHLARVRLTRLERAQFAAGLSTGAVVVYPLTAMQAAAMMKVSLFDVTEARRNGKPRNGRSNGHTETLAEHIKRSSPAERLEAARVVGVAAVWDDMIAPVIEDRTSASPSPVT
jgi:hypothetical protein